jgi:hypothetical protein
MEQSILSDHPKIKEGPPARPAVAPGQVIGGHWIAGTLFGFLTLASVRVEQR